VIIKYDNIFYFIQAFR